jgi:hypothetical protein
MFSLAPRGFDAASIVLYSASDPSLFRRVYSQFSDVLNTHPARVALLFAAARILSMMTTVAYAQLRVYEPNVREAVRLVLGRDDFRSAG